MNAYICETKTDGSKDRFPSCPSVFVSQIYAFVHYNLFVVGKKINFAYCGATKKSALTERFCLKKLRVSVFWRTFMAVIAIGRKSL